MKSRIYSAPAIEPVTLVEVKQWLRLESVDFGDDITVTQSIAPGAHAIAASYSLTGAAVDVSGVDAIISLNAGTCGTGGTVDVKAQESEDGTTWTDWSGGSFTQVTEANDNAVHEKEYTGTKRYIRAVATVATASCAFGVNVITGEAESAEDDKLNGLIATVREYAEDILNRRLITQTWDVYFDDWPDGSELEMPYGELQSVTWLKYTDCDDTETTVSTDDYYVDTISDPGQVVLKHGKSWPSATLRTYAPITARIVCGYGDTADDVPSQIKTAIKIGIAKLYQFPDDMVMGTIHNELGWMSAYLLNYRIVRF